MKPAEVVKMIAEIKDAVDRRNVVLTPLLPLDLDALPASYGVGLVNPDESITGFVFPRQNSYRPAMIGAIIKEHLSGGVGNRSAYIDVLLKESSKVKRYTDLLAWLVDGCDHMFFWDGTDLYYHRDRHQDGALVE